MINEKIKKLLESNKNKNKKVHSKIDKIKDDTDNISLSDILDTTANFMLKRLYDKEMDDTELRDEIINIIKDDLLKFISIKIKIYAESFDSTDRFIRYNLLDLYLTNIILDKGEELEKYKLSTKSDIVKLSTNDKVRLLIRLEPDIYKVRNKNRKLFEAVCNKYGDDKLPLNIKLTLVELIQEIMKEEL